MVGVISGKALYFTINGATINGPFSWRKRGSADKLDGTTGLDAGYGSTKAGVRQIEVTMGCIINILVGLVISEQSTLTDVKLFYAVGDVQPAIWIPTFTVLSAEKGAEVRGRFELNISGENDGIYYEYV